MAKRENFIICMKASLAEYLKNTLVEQKMCKSTFIHQAVVEKLAFDEMFRQMMQKSLDEQGRDADYYDLLQAFKKLDEIKSTYQSAMKKVVKIFMERV